MAVEFSALTKGGGTATNSYNTASISPGANKLIILSIVVDDNNTPSISSVSGNGLTWVEIATVTRGTNWRMSVYRAMGASPSAGAVTITFSETVNTVEWIIDEATNVDPSGTNGSGAVVQSNIADVSNDTTPSITLGAFGSTANATYGVFGAGAGDTTKGANFTELQEQLGGNTLATEYAVNNQTTVDWTTDTSTEEFAFAMEVKVIPGSASASASSSRSASASQSPSASLSPSASGSASASKSLSPSASQSPSSSVSPSPSVGYTGYTRGDEAALPGNDTDLETAYSAQNVTDVATDDAVRVGQTGTLQFMIHQFKNFVTSPGAILSWNGQTSLSPASSNVRLQIYNRNTTTWETIDTYGAATPDTDFNLGYNMTDLTDYKDNRNVISCRVYQEAI